MEASSVKGVHTPKPPRITLGHFILPAHHERVPFDFGNATIAAIVPTYKPRALTVRLIQALLRSSPNLLVYVVDDCTPREEGSEAIFKRIATISKRVTLLRTPENKLKAGALNHALARIFAEGRRYPDVVLTLDDDVVIAENTVRNLVTELMSSPELGAVCSQSRVFNKNKNLLTRLQGLEYLGFNAIRMADEGFFRGPLVMHGMLTAFRTCALRELGGFSESHLIEDYEVTARLKAQGWSVKSAVNAPAWTVVPEGLSRLWRQRTRWSYGGVTVVAGARSLSSVFQDILGHTLFVSMLLMIGILLFLRGEGDVPPYVADIVITLSLLQLGITYTFQLWLMRFYKEKDAWDWLIRLLLVPEFLYSYLMTVALVGSYFFHSFNVLKQSMRLRPTFLVRAGVRIFRACGYTEGHWGTRVQLPLP
ncbi:glycosyltransferase [Candidatus Kaiserbacteria bacterium]|nr:glycosyltransferase [Candidatus Kaiserbacteria bacterium]